MPTEANNTEVTGGATDANLDPNMSTPERDDEASKAGATLTWEKVTRDAWNCLEKARLAHANA
jgi:hypothetical protein